MKWMLCTVTALVSVLVYLSSSAEGQIPKLCANDTSLRGNERRCCPNNCSEETSRGRCENVGGMVNNEDLRVNWPAFYFTHVCQCNHPYGGVDCLSCAYGRYPPPTCDQTSTEKRKNLKDLSPSDWEEYLDAIRMIRELDPPEFMYTYEVIVNGENFNSDQGYQSISDQAQNVSLYDFFVWTHYLVSKDNVNNFAHGSAGFLTWHRQMLLWLEWEIQQRLYVRGINTYYRFRLPYWDWTDPNERTKYFKTGMLGASLYDTSDGTSADLFTVYGDLFGADGTNWPTKCWDRKDKPNDENNSCDPSQPTGYLKRCPKRTDGKNPCDETIYWPTAKDVTDALSQPNFDTTDDNGKYSKCSPKDSFRNFLEGFYKQSQDCNPDDRMCSPGNNCNLSRRLHNSVHLILGAGDARNANISDDSDLMPEERFNSTYILVNNRGVMAHVAASPNDPIFINHHAMIDCIFEQWLKNNRQATYPKDVGKDGHRRDDYIVPFIPAFSHKDMFKTADNFGYSCDLSDIVNRGGGNNGGGGGNNSGEVARPLVFTIIYLISVVAAAVM